MIEHPCKYSYKPDKIPKTRCWLCWESFFNDNVGKTAAWIAMLELHGFKFLEGAKGTRFTKALSAFNEELKKKKGGATDA